MRPEVAETIDAIAGAAAWSTRVQLIRRVPEAHGVAAHRQIYAELARRLYVPALTPDFAYVHWREEYEFDVVVAAYRTAYRATQGSFVFRSTTSQASSVSIRKPRLFGASSWGTPGMSSPQQLRR